MDDLVTVIIPVYNVSEFIERCITSVLTQTHTALQIIIINDGSTDGSGEMCDEFAEQDSRIEVIHQINAGVSVARNVGLDRVRGEWIAFVDSDDYASPYYIEDMLVVAIQDNCDIVVCHSENVQACSTEQIPFKRLDETRVITGYDGCVLHFGKTAGVLNAVHCKVYRACLWDALRFPVGKVHEDTFVSHELIYSAKRIALMDAVLYAYVQSIDSIIRGGFSLRRILDSLDAAEEGVRFYDMVGKSDLTHIARRVYCSRVFDAWCTCKKEIPNQRDIMLKLQSRAKEAYSAAKPIRGYIDCSPRKTFAYSIKLFIGRWCHPLYAALFYLLES